MSAKVLREGADRVYQAAQAWVDAALRSDSSLFHTGQTRLDEPGSESAQGALPRPTRCIR